MKKLLLFTLAIGTTCFAADVKTPTTLTERFSYAVGMQIGSDFGSKEMEIDFDLFLSGVKAAYADDTTLLTKEDASEVLKQAWEDYQARAKAKRESAGIKTKKEGDDYLAANRKKPGVKTTPSGLQYRVIKPGKGNSPGRNDRAVVHYRGWTLAGKELNPAPSLWAG